MKFQLITRSFSTIKKCRCWPHSACHWRDNGACDHDVHTENILKIMGSTTVRPEIREGTEDNALHEVLSWTRGRERDQIPNQIKN